MARARWWHMLQGSKKEALLAVDLYNRPGDDRRLEAFVVHMQIAWTYLLHAKFERDQTDYWYRDANTNRRMRIEGDFKTFELARCVKLVFPNQEHPVRRNLEFFVSAPSLRPTPPRGRACRTQTEPPKTKAISRTATATL